MGLDDEGKGNPVGLQFLGRAGRPKSQGLGSLGAVESVESGACACQVIGKWTCHWDGYMKMSKRPPWKWTCH